MDINKVEINVKALYKSMGDCTKYHAINHGYEDGEEYYDLLDKYGNLACINGETASVVSFAENSVELIIDDIGKPFRLTIDELQIART